MERHNFWDDYEEFEARRNAHKRPYYYITGAQSTMERAIDAWSLDTSIGQGVELMKRYFEHDAVGDPKDYGFNPFTEEGLLDGYENHLDEFLGITSAKEVEIQKDMINQNMAYRRNLDGHFWARMMGNIADPINLLPIPLAKGVGFVKGFKRGAAGVALPYAISEGARAELDPTNPWYEPVFAITGGALFGGMFGGALGMWGKGDWDSLSKSWFELHEGFVESHNKIFSKKGYSDQDIRVRPLEKELAEIDTLNTQNRAVKKEHLQTIIEMNHGESIEAYSARLDKYLDDDLYDDFVLVATHYNPDKMASTFTGIEKARFSEHPFFMAVNNRFKGKLGLDISRMVMRLGGTPGLITKGAAEGDTVVAQGVFNRAKMHDVHAIEFRTEMFNAFKGSQGRPETAGDMTAGQQVVQSFADLVTGQYKHYEEFLDVVMRHYATGTKPDSPHILRGMDALKKYTSALEKEAKDAGVIGIKKKQNEVDQLDSVLLENRAFLRKYLYGDPTSANLAFKQGREVAHANDASNLKKKLELLADLETKGASQLDRALQTLAYMERYNVADSKKQNRLKLNRLVQRQGLTSKQHKLAKKVRKEADELEIKVKQDSDNIIAIRAYLNDPEKFMAQFAEGSAVPFNLELFLKVYERHKKLNADKKILKEWKEGIHDVVPDKVAWGYFPRVFNREAAINNRQNLREVLVDWYKKDGGEGQRAEETIDAILKERNPGMVKRVLREGLEDSGAGEATIARMEKRVDDIWNRKKGRKETMQMHMEVRTQALTDLMTTYMKDFGFGDSINFRVSQTMAHIDNMASAGMPEGFGASTSLMTRRLDIPSHLLMKGGPENPNSKAVVDFIELNPENLVRNYHKRMSASIEMAREFGDSNASGEILRLRDRIELEARKAKTKGEAEAIRAEGKKSIQAIEDLLEKTLGVYKLPQDPTTIGQRSLRFTKNWMVLALMGQAGIAALADLGRGVMSVGIHKAFGSALIRFGEGAQEFRKAGKAIQTEIGEAGEIAMHGRFNAIMDVDSYNLGNSWAEKLFQGGVNKMFMMNMLAPWTDMMKRFYGSLIVSDMSRISKTWAGEAKLVTEVSEEFGSRTIIRGKTGKITKAEEQFMRRNGISLEDAIVMADQLKKHGDVGQHLQFANVDKWTDKEMARRFKTAAITEINNAVITPGVSEKLNFMATPVGQLMTQFKSFAISATHRTFLAGLQQRDARVVQGILATVAMGYIVDLIKSPSYDKRDLASLDRIIQAVDYSGVTGMVMDINNMLEFATAHRDSIPHMGIRPLFGVDSPWISETKVPSWAQRIGQPGGPAVSLFGDLAYSIFDPDAQGSDMTRSMRRLLPFNNLLYIDWLFDRLQRDIGLSLDREE